MKKKHPLLENYERFFGRLMEGSVIVKRRTTMTPWDDVKNILDEFGMEYTFDQRAGGFVIPYKSDLDHEQIFDELEPAFKNSRVMVSIEPLEV